MQAGIRRSGASCARPAHPHLRRPGRGHVHDRRPAQGARSRACKPGRAPGREWPRGGERVPLDRADRRGRSAQSGVPGTGARVLSRRSPGGRARDRRHARLPRAGSRRRAGHRGPGAERRCGRPRRCLQPRRGSRGCRERGCARSRRRRAPPAHLRDDVAPQARAADAPHALCLGPQRGRGARAHRCRPVPQRHAALPHPRPRCGAARARSTPAPPSPAAPASTSCGSSSGSASSARRGTRPSRPCMRPCSRARRSRVGCVAPPAALRPVVVGRAPRPRPGGLEAASACR